MSSFFVQLLKLVWPPCVPLFFPFLLPRACWLCALVPLRLRPPRRRPPPRSTCRRIPRASPPTAAPQERTWGASARATAGGSLERPPPARGRGRGPPSRAWRSCRRRAARCTTRRATRRSTRSSSAPCAPSMRAKRAAREATAPKTD